MNTFALPPSNELNALLQDIERLNEELKKNPQLLDGTRLKNIDLSGLVLDGAALSNLHWRNIVITNGQLSNITVKNSRWIGVQFIDSVLDQVNLHNVDMEIDKDVSYGNTAFRGGKMTDVIFTKSEMYDVVIRDLESSRISFIDSRFTHESVAHDQQRSTISDSELHLTIKDSRIEPSIFRGMKYPTEIYIENSKVAVRGMINGIGGALKRAEIRNSHYVGKVGNSVDYAYVENSEIDAGFIKSKFVHLKNNEYVFSGDSDIGSLGLVKIDTVIIDECSNPLIFAVGRPNTIQNLYIRNCALPEPSINNAHIGKLDICNSTIDSMPNPSIRAADKTWWYRDAAWDNGKIRELNLYNVQFQGDLPSKVKDLQIGTLGSDGQHPIPAQIQNAATHTTRLTQCPTLPDVEALKQKALSEEPVASLTDSIWATIDSGLPVPFEKIEAEGKQLQFTFNRDWLHATQALYTMAPTPTLPPIRAVTLSEYDDDIGTDNYTFQSYIDIKLKSPEHYRPVAGRDPDTLYAESDRPVESFNSRLHMLILWFEPNEHLPEYAHTPPLAINIVLPDVINNRLFARASWSLSAYKMNRVQWPKEPFMQTV